MLAFITLISSCNFLIIINNEQKIKSANDLT